MVGSRTKSVDAEQQNTGGDADNADYLRHLQGPEHQAVCAEMLNAEAAAGIINQIAGGKQNQPDRY